MSSYPSLFPSGFLEFEDNPCMGPILYRSQPSRESTGITELNEVVSRYGAGQYKGGDLISLARNLKNIARSWDKLPSFAKKDFLKLMKDSESSLGKDLKGKDLKGKESKVEHFGDNVNLINDYTDKRTQSILSIILIAIVAIVIGFMISCV